MEFYFAPMEGITGYVFRQAYERYFSNIDSYFTPFIAPSQNKSLNSRELNDILPQHNPGIKIIPQILTNNSRDFITAFRELKKYGYEQVNLNLGCPSRTVVSKGRGAGFLGNREGLLSFLTGIFEAGEGNISIKTRTGLNSPDEIYGLMEIFNRFPLTQLIIHPRVQKDYYSGRPDWELFGEALAVSKNPVCYNGDIFSAGDYEAFVSRFPSVDRIMLGRGLLRNPGLNCRLREGASYVLEKDTIRGFHDMIYEGYQEIMPGERPVLFKMKELWSYMALIFTNHEKYAKKIKKAESSGTYEKIVDGLFREQDLVL